MSKKYLVFTVVLTSKSTKILGFYCWFDIKKYNKNLIFTVVLTSKSTKNSCFLRCFGPYEKKSAFQVPVTSQKQRKKQVVFVLFDVKNNVKSK